MPIHVAITDDHPLIINGLQNILRTCPGIECTQCYLSGKELLAGLEQQQPDVLLLDIQMPELTGEELAGIISKKYPRVKILALTNMDNVYFIKGMLQQGVLGYILKNTGEEKLVEAIRTVYRGEQFLEPELKERVLQYTLSTKKERARQPALSRREKDVLQLIAANHTSQEIADKLFLSKRTIDNYRLSLLLKLDVKNAPSLIKKAIDMGLID